MSKTWEKVFYVITWICQGSSYLSPYGYGVMHRLHHAYPDTEKDPHSPKYSDNLFSMMWDTKTIYSAIKKDQYPVEEQYKKGVPNWKAFDKFASSWFSKIGWGVFYTLFYIQFATHWWMFLLLPIHYIMGPVHGAVINWFAHKFGYVNFKVSDTSKNILPFDFLMFGEGYHNNHHKYGGRANFGVKWFEIDPAYIIIKILNGFGIIKIKKAQS